MLKIAALFLLFLSGCTQQGVVEGKNYNYFELKYLLGEKFKPLFYCDPDDHPIGVREEAYNRKVREALPGIIADSERLSTILAKLEVSESALADFENQKMAYEESQWLKGAVLLEDKGNGNYGFHLHSGTEAAGKRLSGTINTKGQIVVEKQEDAFNTCPICTG